MPTTRHHMRLDVEGCLLRWHRGSHHGMTHDDGRPMTNLEAKAELLRLFGQGVKYLPIGDCDTFDPEKGCPGHPVETPA